MTSRDPQILLADLAEVGDAIRRVIYPLTALQSLARSEDQNNELLSASESAEAAKCINALGAFLRKYEWKCFRAIPAVQLAVCSYPNDGIVSLAGQKGATWTELAFGLAKLFYDIAIDCEGDYSDSLECNDNVEPILDSEAKQVNLNECTGDFEELKDHGGDYADLDLK